MVQITTASVIVAATIAMNIVPAISAPVSQDNEPQSRDFNEFEARDTNSGDLELRSGRITKIAGNVFDAVGQDKMKQKVKDITRPPPPAIAGPMAEAGKKMNQALANNGKKIVAGAHKKLKRDLDGLEELYARFLDESDLELRSGRITKVAGNVFDAIGQDKMKQKVKDITRPPPPAIAGHMAEAGKKMNQALANNGKRIVADSHKKSKRDLGGDLEELYTRFLDEFDLELRSGRIGKVAGSVFDAIGQDKMKQKVKDITRPPPPAIAAPLAEAGRKMNQAMINHGKNKEMLANIKKKGRSLDEFDLEMRSGRAGKIAGSVFDAMGQDKLKQKVKDITRPPPPAIAGPLAEAGKKMNQALANHGKKVLADAHKKSKRDLDGDLEDLYARFLDELVERELDELD